MLNVVTNENRGVPLTVRVDTLQRRKNSCLLYTLQRQYQLCLAEQIAANFLS